MIVTLCTVCATLMQALDQTIANVALPYMQGSLSASYDEIVWVLTSYITAAAIMTAPVGWLAARFGRKYLYILCLVGFTGASVLCGAAQSLGQIVVFRVLQGMFGAALVPLSQTTMMDIYPAEKRGQAMAIWGMGVMVGPILGPTLGGYLTEMYNWRYVFYINVPFGILATLGLVFCMPPSHPNFNMKFDWIGFGVLSLAIGALQTMLDRGQDQDWFSSSEILIEAILGALGAYLFVVHMFTGQRPFIPPAVFKDRNFVSGLAMMFAAGTVLVSSSSLMAPSKTPGATKPSARSPATNVEVFQWPCGVRSIRRCPRGARPRSRTMLVLTPSIAFGAQPSMKISFFGSSEGCCSRQASRLATTSARSSSRHRENGARRKASGRRVKKRRRRRALCFLKTTTLSPLFLAKHGY